MKQNEDRRIILRASLFIVPTPIGNLADITQRALEVLQAVNLVAAEDASSAGFIAATFLGLMPGYFALHDHNEQQKAETLVAK